MDSTKNNTSGDNGNSTRHQNGEHIGVNDNAGGGGEALNLKDLGGGEAHNDGAAAHNQNQNGINGNNENNGSNQMNVLNGNNGVNGMNRINGMNGINGGNNQVDEEGPFFIDAASLTNDPNAFIFNF